METKPNVAEAALKFIVEAIQKGKTVCLNTAYRSVEVTPKNYEKWEKSGHKLFKFDDEGNLRMARGKQYDIIATKTYCFVKIISQ